MKLTKRHWDCAKVYLRRLYKTEPRLKTYKMDDGAVFVGTTTKPTPELREQMREEWERMVRSRPCDVCGKGSSVWVRDLTLVPSTDGWAHYKPHSVHYFCEDHERESIIHNA